MEGRVLREEEGQRSFGNWAVGSDGGYCPKGLLLENSRTLCSLQMWGTSGDLGKQMKESETRKKKPTKN